MKKIILGAVLLLTQVSFLTSEETRESKSVMLSGYLSLSGSIYVPSQNSYASGYVNGWLSLRDSSGEYYTNNTYLNVYVGFFVNSNYVYVTAYPNQYLTVYKNGKSVGSVYITQGVGLSGWLNGNFVNLNGSSYINQTAYVSE